MFLHSHVFYCWPCGLQHLCRPYGLQNLCIIADMDPGTSPKHDREHANYYIYCPTYTHIPEISFPKPRTQFFMAYLHKTFLRASPRGGDGSQVITEFFRYLRASRISLKRKTLSGLTVTLFCSCPNTPSQHRMRFCL